MRAVFGRKRFQNAAAQPGDENLAKQIQFVDVDKFALCAFNELVYNREISGFLTASSFLELLEYYIPKLFLRRINLNTFYRKIPSLLFPEGINIDFSD